MLRLLLEGYIMTRKIVSVVCMCITSVCFGDTSQDIKEKLNENFRWKLIYLKEFRIAEDNNDPYAKLFYSQEYKKLKQEHKQLQQELNKIQKEN